MRKNILITGASSGLGMGMAKEFAKQGCHLALCARRTERLETLKKELLTINPSIEVLTSSLDVNDTEAVFSIFDSFRTAFETQGGTLDRVIVNAGIGRGGSLGKGLEGPNRETAMTNFCAALTQMEAALKIFRDQNHGHLVAVSSMSAFRGYPGALNVYAATKAGLKSLAEGARIEVYNRPIKVTTLFPGYIQSEMTDSIGKPPPYMISLEKGSRLLVKAIDKEKNTAIIPFWPWYFFKIFMNLLSPKMVRIIFG
jgi:short-subunit dehydrogenase